MVAAVRQLRNALAGSKIFLFSDDEAACAALTRGATNVSVALVLLYISWSHSAKCNMSLWTGRAS